MKGVELPINTIVILVIALIILLAILALFFSVWRPGVGGITLEAAKNNACQMLISTGCGDTNSIIVKDFDADEDGNLGTAETGSGWTWGTSVCGGAVSNNGDNLASLCACQYGKSDEDACKTICNCP